MNFPLGIERLLDLMKSNKIYHVKLSHENQEIEIKRKRNHQPEIKIKPETEDDDILSPDSKYIISEHIGVYFEAEKPVEAGAKVKKDQIIGYIETGNIKHPIKAEENCTIEKILVEHNEIVEYGLKLFVIKGDS